MVESSRTFIQSPWAGAEHSPQKLLSAQVCHAGEHQEEMHEEQVQIPLPSIIFTAF